MGWWVWAIEITIESTTGTTCLPGARDSHRRDRELLWDGQAQVGHVGLHYPVREVEK